MKYSHRTVASLLALSLLGGCSTSRAPGAHTSPSPNQVTEASPTPHSPPGGSQSELPGATQATVKVTTIGAESVTLDKEYTAHILAVDEVEVRSRIEGNLLAFSFREGSTVFAGQTLFQIDPRPLQAAVNNARAKVMEAEANLEFARTRVNWKKAKADLAQAEANLANQQREVDRYRPLMERSIIPRQLYDQTVSARDVAQAQLDAALAEVENTAIRDTSSIAQSEAALSAAVANLENAQLNLDYTTIEAPITGVVGELNVTPGNLVQPGQAVLATISSTNPMYVEFAISESDYLALVRRREAGEEIERQRIFQLILADGKPYQHLGRFELIDRAIDPATGSIKIRVSFPNPDGSLRPGEFVRLKLNREDVPDALLVPQRAVQELQSSSFVYVVDRENKIVQKEIELGSRYQSFYIVTSGLVAGDRVVTDGAGRVKPGMTVSVEADNS